MSTDPRSVFEAALQLPEEERLALAAELLESVPPEDAGLSMDAPQLIEELNRRFEDSEGAIPWHKLKAEG